MSEDGGLPRVHRLVSFLGLGQYRPVRYTLDGRIAPETPYVCRGLAALVKPAEIVVLATEDAEKAHYARLKEELAEQGAPPPDLVRIKNGEKASELWDQFRVIKDQVQACDGPIALDITHGFRSQPFFAAAVAGFVRAVDEVPPELRIYYGAFEARDRETALAPVWDLTAFVTLLDWTHSLRLFLRTGRAEEEAAAAGRLGKELRDTWYLTGQCGPEPNLGKLGKALSEFGSDLGALRTGDLLIGHKGPSSARRLLAEAERAQADLVEQIPPLAEVLDRITAMAAPLAGLRQDLTGPEGHRAVAELAKLYLRLGRYPEAFATVREGWINRHATPAAACPGMPGFDTGLRTKAKARTFGLDPQFQAVTDRRNDLLHAQYRPKVGAQDAGSIIKTVRDLVEQFESLAVPAEPAEAPPPVFLNLSNHPSAGWDAAQTDTARALAGQIIDLKFPAVPPEADGAAVAELARQCLSAVPPGTTHALVQGEFTLVLELVWRLQDRGVTCLAATTERQTTDHGDGRRTSTFRFVRFRPYATRTEA